jgi:ketosteroid isomerase-like protein
MPSDGSPRTPQEVFLEGLARLMRQDLAGYLDLFHDDIVFEFPFAPDDRPRRLDGKAAVAEYLSRLPGAIEVEEAPDLRIYETTDPNTIIVEMSVKGRLTATGAPYAQSYVIVLVAEDGLITRYRDYWNPLVALDTAASA